MSNLTTIHRVIRDTTKDGGIMYRILTSDGRVVCRFPSTMYKMRNAGYEFIENLENSGDGFEFTVNRPAISLHNNIKGYPDISDIQEYDDTMRTSALPRMLSDKRENHRQMAIKQAQAIMSNPSSVVVFDTETTGVREEDEIIQFSAVNGLGTVLLNTRIKPTDNGLQRLKDGTSSTIHGILPSDLINAPSYLELHETITDIFDSHDYIVAYNQVFDVGMVRNDTNRHGLKESNKLLGVKDAMIIYTEYAGQFDVLHQKFKWVKLIDACSDCGIPIRNAHDATEDCLMTVDLLTHIAR